mgnify:FL=1
MRRAQCALLLVSLVLLSVTPVNQPSELTEDGRTYWTGSDTGSKISYTDEHTTATIGPSDRLADLRMPGGHDYSRPLPLVVSLHGYSGSGAGNAAYMHHFDSVHENEHLLLTPNGNFNWLGMRYWNATDACCNYFNSDVDDVGYLVGLINEAIQNYGADPDGVIVTGLSNGGFMSHRMACDAGNIIRAIVALNGVTWDDFSDCSDTGRPDILHVHSTADGVIWYDGGSLGGTDYPSANETVNYWADRSGCNTQWTYLGDRDISGDDGLYETDEFEFRNCASGNRVALWRINGGTHVPPLNDPGWADQTLEWALDGFVRDSDGDGYRDDVDLFIYNPDEWADNDADGWGDNIDDCDLDPTGYQDVDGDGICYPQDLFPNNPNEWSDADGDGIGDRSDADDDNDGVADYYDAFPLDPNEWDDTDGDGIGDNADTDDDGDGWEDSMDAFPLDPNEHSDYDGDGKGDNEDFDDDNDGWTDEDELSCMTDPMDENSEPLDTDGDWICDLMDDDDDGDGSPDSEDLFPLDPSEWADVDEDGVGDNADVFPTDDTEWVDSDGDGVGDNSDAFPDNPLEWLDTDGDGIGDNSDVFPEDASEWVDTDSDGVGDNSDAFPEDAGETTDSDGDGVGDNSDAFPEDGTEWVDSDGDGVGDNSDAFPDIASEWIDTDGDGVGDNADLFPTDSSEWIDTDGDGVGDNADAFPMDASETLDSDGDGVGDNADYAPFDSEVWEEPPDYTLIALVGIVIALMVAVAYTGRRQT